MSEEKLTTGEKIITIIGVIAILSLIGYGIYLFNFSGNIEIC